MWQNNCFLRILSFSDWSSLYSVFPVNAGGRKWGKLSHGSGFRLWNKSRDKEHDIRSTCTHTYSMYPCVLYHRNISGPPTTGPSDCRTLGLLGPRSVGTLGLMGGHRWILCTNHCFPRGRTAGKLNFPVYLNITFTYSLWCDLSCLNWKSSKKIIWSRSLTKPTKWTVRPDKMQIHLGICSVWSVFTVRMKKYLYQSLNRLPIWNSQNCSMFPLAFVAESLQGHWWGFISRNYVVWPISFLMNVFIGLKGTHFLFLFGSLATHWMHNDLFCLCWGLTSQSTIFQSCRDGATASWVINQYFPGVKCLAQGHNTAAVGIEPPTSCSGVRHSTTEPPRSPECTMKTDQTVRMCRLILVFAERTCYYLGFVVHWVIIYQVLLSGLSYWTSSSELLGMSGVLFHFYFE